MTGEDAKMNCRIIEGADQINADEVVKLLRTTYWANKRSKEQIRKSMDNSVCYGVYLDDEQKISSMIKGTDLKIVDTRS